MAKAFALDWGAIRQEYAATDLSFRKLAARFNCSHNTIAKKARAENWAADREQVRAKRLTAAAEAQGAAMAKGVQECVQVAQKLLERIRMRVEADEAPILPNEYRQISGAIRDIREILTSDLDIERKRADIEQIRHNMGEGKDNTIRVIMEGGADYDG